MKKIFNFHNFDVACFIVIIILTLCSFTGTYSFGYRTYHVDTVRVSGSTYVVAITNDGGIAICPAK